MAAESNRVHIIQAQADQNIDQQIGIFIRKIHQAAPTHCKFILGCDNSRSIHSSIFADLIQIESDRIFLNPTKDDDPSLWQNLNSYISSTALESQHDLQLLRQSVACVIDEIKQQSHSWNAIKGIARRFLFDEWPSIFSQLYNASKANAFCPFHVLNDLVSRKIVLLIQDDAKKSYGFEAATERNLQRLAIIPPPPPKSVNMHIPPPDSLASAFEADESTHTSKSRRLEMLPQSSALFSHDNGVLERSVDFSRVVNQPYLEHFHEHLSESGRIVDAADNSAYATRISKAERIPDSIPVDMHASLARHDSFDEIFIPPADTNISPAAAEFIYQNVDAETQDAFFSDSTVKIISGVSFIEKLDAFIKHNYSEEPDPIYTISIVENMESLLLPSPETKSNIFRARLVVCRQSFESYCSYESGEKAKEEIARFACQYMFAYWECARDTEKLKGRQLSSLFALEPNVKGSELTGDIKVADSGTLAVVNSIGTSLQSLPPSYIFESTKKVGHDNRIFGRCLHDHCIGNNIPIKFEYEAVGTCYRASACVGIQIFASAAAHRRKADAKEDASQVACKSLDILNSRKKSNGRGDFAVLNEYCQKHKIILTHTSWAGPILLGHSSAKSKDPSMISGIQINGRKFESLACLSKAESKNQVARTVLEYIQNICGT